MPVAASTSGGINEEFLRLLFLDAHCDDSVLVEELSEESPQFRFIRVVGLVNLKGSIGLMLAKPSAMRVTIPLDFISVIHSVTTFYSHSHYNTSFNTFYSVV